MRCYEEVDKHGCASNWNTVASNRPLFKQKHFILNTKSKGHEGKKKQELPEQDQIAPVQAFL